ncbi:Androgen-induced protein [Actinidia chinensis var. chinensis]|uniref:Androgen-induced protein n=1 Tax=Actinidia chinensis var. chinensis TaxID=1590841 RepID=A0A2R6PCT7_ACTCC|nr:Androgen-induced protein [Actinidia chinensis var. chinensis]
MMSAERLGLEYWIRWQVPVCALIFILPTLVALRLAKTRFNKQPLHSSDLWIPCWRNLNPLWLLSFRASAFASMAFMLYQVLLVLGGAFSFYFYTQWTFALVTLYFALATILSARGCWTYSKKSFPGDGEMDENKGNAKFHSHYNKEEIKCNAGFLERLVQAIYQTGAGASMLTDIVFWGLLYPFVLDEKFRLTLLIGCTHSLNAIFLILDSALNSQPFPWYGLTYFVLWSASYVVFQWILHACGFTWWPYPFLELATPWAPLWYFALALVHIPCYGMYVLLVKAKGSIFPRMFPYAFVRNSLEKKQT